ncbi:MAG: HWE histidine kinase domain-containing protein [Methylocystis sp.]
MELEPQRDWAVSDVYITEELNRRPPTETDSLREKLALQDLARRMADHPAEVLPRFVDLAMEMTGGVSAGLSLFEPDPAPGVFRWRYLRGLLAPFEDATTPRNFSPCGVTLDLDTPVLSSHPERVYDWIADADIVAPEVLLVPLYIRGKEPLGTLWIVSEREGHFDSGHARMMNELSTFVGIALRMLDSERRLKEALEQQERLASEMSHRVKNFFALTEGIVRVSERAATTPAEMSKLLSGRLEALAEANALVHSSFGNKIARERVELAELVAKIMRPHEAPDARSRFVSKGPPTWLGERATNGLALVLHELATNAAKYGALKSEEGVVELSWRVEAERLVLYWSELGGPPIAQAPESSGFGTRLSQSTIVSQFEGELGYKWRPEGLLVSMKIPVASLSR